MSKLLLAQNTRAWRMTPQKRWTGCSVLATNYAGGVGPGGAEVEDVEAVDVGDGVGGGQS